MDNTVGIRLAGCGKTFADGTRALERVDLDINTGETVVLLGLSLLIANWLVMQGGWLTGVYAPQGQAALGPCGAGDGGGGDGCREGEGAHGGEVAVGQDQAPEVSPGEQGGQG